MLQEREIFSDVELKLFAEGPTIPRKLVVQVLRFLRESWQDVADEQGIRLQDAYGSAGLIIVDLIVAFQLNEAEAYQVLGITAYRDLERLISEIEPPVFSD